MLLRSIQPHSPLLVLLPLPKLVYFHGWYVCEERTRLVFVFGVSFVCLVLVWGVLCECVLGGGLFF